MEAVEKDSKRISLLLNHNISTRLKDRSLEATTIIADSYNSNHGKEE